MRRFRRSEIFFLSVGFALIAGSLSLLKNNISLVRFFNMHLSSGDAFEASYYERLSNDAPLKVMKTPPAPSATPIEEEPTSLSIYLISPINQAFVLHPKDVQTTPMITFHYEIYPKTMDSTFELLFKKKVVETVPSHGSTNGTHEISIPMPLAGLYEWRVQAADKTSELRTLIVRQPH